MSRRNRGNVINFADYYSPKPKQRLAHQDPAQYLLFGGAMGGGKSWFLCAEAIMNAMRYPNNRLAIIRKQRTTIAKTILVTFFKICPKEIIAKYNKSSLTVTFINGSELLFIEADRSKDPTFNKIKGLEIGWAGFDEANEISEEVFNVIISRLRWVCDYKDSKGKRRTVIPNYRIRLTSNPENCWLIPKFIESKDPNYKYIESLTTDNFGEDSDYVKQMQSAFAGDKNMLDRYLGGKWTFGDGIAQLIPNSLIDLLFTKAVAQQGDHNWPSMGVDVARYGDDHTCFVIMQGGEIKLIETWSKTSVIDVANRIEFLMQQYNVPAWRVGVDVVGVGAGVADALVARRVNVAQIVAGAAHEKDIHSTEFNILPPLNLRAQMFWALKNDIASDKLGGLAECKFYTDGVPQGRTMSDKVREELSWIEFSVGDGKRLKIAGKDHIKKHHGKSPDIADALSICNWIRRKKKPSRF